MTASPGLPERRRRFWSQIHGLSANANVPGLERVSRDDVDSYAQQILKILEQADMIEKRSAWLKVHQEIQVTIRASLAPGHRAEYGDPLSSAIARHPEYLRAAPPQTLHRQHVVGHLAKISPRTSAANQ
jgi:hypothetical protein